MSKSISEAVTELVGPPMESVISEEGKIDYEKTKAPNFSSDNQPGKKKKKSDDDEE